MATNYSKIVSLCSYNIYDHGFPRVQLASFSSSLLNHRFPRVYTLDAAVGSKTGYVTFDPVIATAK